MFTAEAVLQKLEGKFLPYLCERFLAQLTLLTGLACEALKLVKHC